jgi:hypothetical protein
MTEMRVFLAMAWKPRQELRRFRAILPALEPCYAGIVISLPPDTPADLVSTLAALSPGYLEPVVTQEWPWGRHAALGGAYQLGADLIQYTDFDRMVRWVEREPQEWQAIFPAMQQADCLVVGRTPGAYQTHPQALVMTEMVSNRVASFLLGRSLDVSAGCKGFSRRAAKVILENSIPGHALGTDAEWPLLVQRAGYSLAYLEVEGLDWESADQFQDQLATLEMQQAAAARYDADPRNWAYRIEVANEVVHFGLEAAQKQLL